MTQNAIANRVTIVIPDADLQIIQSALKTLQSTLVPYLIDLGPDARRSLPKLGPKSVDFVGKTLDYTLANPQMIMSYVDVDDFQIDSTTMRTLRTLQQSLAPLTHLVDSSFMQIGSQAYSAALKCYNWFQVATKENVPQAVSISADLSGRFAGMGRKPAAKMTPVTPAIKGSMAPLLEWVDLAMAA